MSKDLITGDVDATTSKLGADMTDERELLAKFLDFADSDYVPNVLFDRARDLLARQPAAIDKQEAKACPECGGSLTTWKCLCDPIWPGYAAPLDTAASKPAGKSRGYTAQLEARVAELEAQLIAAPSVEQDERAAWRDHPAALDAKALATAQEIALMWGRDRSQFVSRIQVAVRDAMDWVRAASAPANVAQAAVAPDGRVVDKAMVKRLAVQYGLLPEQTADVAQGAEAVEDVPEGCTIADAKMLREANHALAAENELLRKRLRPFAHLVGTGELSWAMVEYCIQDDPEKQTFQAPQMQRAFNRAAEAYRNAAPPAQTALTDAAPLVNLFDVLMRQNIETSEESYLSLKCVGVPPTDQEFVRSVQRTLDAAQSASGDTE